MKEKKIPERFKDIVKESIYLTEEENAVIEHQIPITQDLFEQCMSDLVRIGSATGFNHLCHEFPDQYKCYMEKEEAYYGENN